jgi:hypothetical protein
VIVCASGIGAPNGAASAQPTVQAETGRLTQAEEKTFKRIKHLHEDFVYGPNVRRYFYVDPETGNKISVRNELVLEKSDGLIDGQYVSYEVAFDPEMNVINYWFDAGAAFQGWGTILVSDKSIAKSEWACSTTGCDLLVQVDGKTVYGSN